MLDRLSEELHRIGIPRSGARELRRYRLFYSVYPQIRNALTPEFSSRLLLRENSGVSDSQMSRAFQICGKTLISRLSFTHLVELIALDDATKRAFYEVECIRGNWSVRELKRQIASLYYERSDLSRNKQKLSELAQQSAEKDEPKLVIRDPYVFEFLGLRPQEVMSESHLEDQLINKLEAFLLELGHGFCFEARQKRILIGDKYLDLERNEETSRCIDGPKGAALILDMNPSTLRSRMRKLGIKKP